MKPANRGFTLVELLVVIGLIAVVASVVGVSLVGLSRGADMKAAEAQVGSLLNATRSSAVLANREAHFVVNLDVNSPDYVRLLAVVVRNENDTAWELAADPAFLPVGVGVTPEGNVPTEAGLSWPEARDSNFTGTETLSVSGLASGNYGYVQFFASGATFGSPRIVLAGLADSASGVTFVNPEELRMFLVRGSGSYTVLREADSL